MTNNPAESEAALLADPVEQERVAEKRQSPLAGFWRTPKSRAGLLILAFFVLLAIFGPLLAPYSPDALSDDLLQPPSWAHLFGTTQTGQDVFSQFMVGSRSVMIVGTVAGVIATMISLLVGINAALFPGVADELLSALANIFLVIPALPLIILIAGFIPSGGGWVTVALVISVTAWAWGSRVIRAQTLSLRNRDFVQAARATGKSTWSLIMVEILPNLVPIIAGSFVGTVNFAILSQVSLSFIGIGSSNDWNWGTILFWAQGQQALAQGAWWWFIPPGLAIAVLGMGLTLITLGIDEFVNPKLRPGGLDQKALKRAGVRARVGYTAVLLEKEKS
ncbi:ABC transporter permease [Microbacterium sp. NPDC089695]|uniref:ABC transporter permease n=1 Tax=Microbacterium sp. NPDC089695 TaxID=3364198 RepID=UPI0038115317